jgi:hypothetical protein
MYKQEWQVAFHNIHNNDLRGRFTDPSAYMMSIGGIWQRIFMMQSWLAFILGHFQRLAIPLEPALRVHF